MTEKLNDLRELEAAWDQHFNDMLTSGSATPAEAAESMFRVAALIGENLVGPRKTAAILTAAAMYFLKRIPIKDGDDAKKSAVLH